MNKYEAFYKNKRITVEAEKSYEAQVKATEIFKAKKNYDVIVVLVEKNNKEIIHNPCEI
jgi:hypothetical protein